MTAVVCSHASGRSGSAALFIFDRACWRRVIPLLLVQVLGLCVRVRVNQRLRIQVC